MATIAIGDVHGHLHALEDLLKRILPDLRPEDTLVFLGDYIDRGPDPAARVERIIRLKEETQSTVITLTGNHEAWMLKALRDDRSHSWVLGMEAFDTIRSYSREAAATVRKEAERLGPNLITEKLPLPYATFFDRVPASHLSFFRSLKTYHRTADVVCVHGGVDPTAGSVENQRPEDLIWGTDDFPDLYQGPDNIAYGHKNNGASDEDGWPLPRVMSNRTFGLDTISTGVLTGMRFPDGHVYQSRRFLLRAGRQEG